MEKQYYQSKEKNPFLFQNIENEQKRHEMDSLIIYKDLSDNSLRNCFDQLKC